MDLSRRLTPTRRTIARRARFRRGPPTSSRTPTQARNTRPDAAVAHRAVPPFAAPGSGRIPKFVDLFELPTAVIGCAGL